MHKASKKNNRVKSDKQCSIYHGMVRKQTRVQGDRIIILYTDAEAMIEIIGLADKKP